MRAFELSTRALVPGSGLACLDAIAGETVEAACEKVLFGSPDVTAAAVSYVAAQLSLLASAGSKGGSSPAIAALRRAVEADRFGYRGACAGRARSLHADQCGAFFLLQDASRIRENLAQGSFESHVKLHMANWPAADSQPVASTPPAVAPPAPVAGARTPNNLYFPSAASIPPVNIMTAEPPAQRQPDTTGAAEPATPTPPRKPPQGAQPARPPPPPPADPGNAPARVAPM